MKSQVFQSSARSVLALVLTLSGTTVLGLTPAADQFNVKLILGYRLH